MRLITILACVIFTSGAFAGNFSKYYGQTFSQEDLAACEAEASNMTDALDKRDGYMVLEGGCVALGEKRFQIKFTYSHPLASRIERFDREFSSKEQCSLMAQTSHSAFDRAGNFELASFCRGKELTVDYLDLSRSVMRNARLSLSYSTQAACDKFLTDIQEKLAKSSIIGLFGVCNKVVSYDRTKTYFVPEIDFSARYTLAVKFLMGKSLNEGEACFEDSAQVERNFDNNKIELAHAFCANKKYSNERVEVMAYIEKGAFSDRVKTFKGTVYNALAECEYQLEKAAQSLESLGHSKLYNFCKSSNGKRFLPTVYYTEKK